MRLTGLRGVGKTVLLGEFEGLAGTDGWATGSLEFKPGHNVEDALVEAVGTLAQKTKEQLSRAERLRAAVGDVVRSAGSLGLSWGDFTVSYTPSADTREEDLTRALFDVVETAVEKGRSGYVLLLDEAQVVRDERDRHGEHPLSLLVSSVVALQRQEVPLGLVLCGLPTLTLELLKATRQDIYRRLDIDFYEPRVATLTPAEQDVLLATASCAYPPLVVAALNDAVAKSPANINVLLGRLVEAGVLYRIQKGRYDYTAPKFRDYLVRRAQSFEQDVKPRPLW